METDDANAVAEYILMKEPLRILEKGEYASSKIEKTNEHYVNEMVSEKLHILAVSMVK